MVNQPSEMKAPKENGTVILQRTFNQKYGDEIIRYWRIIGPMSHKNYQSDLSIEGLREWGIIR